MKVNIHVRMVNSAIDVSIARLHVSVFFLLRSVYFCVYRQENENEIFIASFDIDASVLSLSKNDEIPTKKV